MPSQIVKRCTGTRHGRVLPLLVGTFLLFALSSCDEDKLLIQPPIGAYSVENFYSTETQIEQAVNSTYVQTRQLNNESLWRTVEMRSDNTTIIPNPNDRGSLAVEEIDYFALTASSGIHDNVWSKCYKGISKANYILAKIDGVPYGDEADRAAKRGEAAFLRAYYYYVLTQTFGDVVEVVDIIESETDVASILSQTRVPREQTIRNLVIPDLRQAIDGLPEEWPATEAGRVTKGAAQTLLAKVYFTDRDYESALPLLNDVIASGLYEILPDYRSIFSPDNRNNAETIFGVQYSVTANQGAEFFIGWLPYQSRTDITEGIFVGTGASKNIPTQDLLDAYEPGDRRRAASIGFYDTDPMDPDNELIPYSRKFLFPPVTSGGSDLVFPTFRYADVLLMRAEALVQTTNMLSNEAFEAVNLLRVRAGLGLLFPGNPNEELNIDTVDKLRAAIRQERRVELAFENHRFWDLLRYGNALEVMLAHGQEQLQLQDFLTDIPEAYQDIRLLFAIPNNLVEQFGYRQNEGWE